MKRYAKKAIILILVTLSLFVFSIPSSGLDIIDHDNDFDFSGGGSDWGGSDSSWDSDGGFYVFGGGGSWVPVVIVVVIVLVVIYSKKGKGTGSHSGPVQMSDGSHIDSSSISRLKQKDPDFSETSMLSKASNLFVTLQMAWSNMDMEPVRPFLSNALYEKYAKQIEEKKARDERNLSSDIAVLMTKLESFQDDGHNEYVNVWLRVRLKDVVVKYSDPSVVLRGSRDKTYYMDFRWQFMRTSGSQTDAATDAVKTGECPSCGASININQSGKCPYCNTVISTTEYDWVLNKVDGIQQVSR